MISGRYPAPKYNRIIEPFAGGAAYSLRYCDREVVINDLSVNTCAVWDFIKSPNAKNWAARIPTSVSKGDKIDDIIDNLVKAPAGLKWMLRSAANVGLLGTGKRSNTITTFGALRWEHNTIKKINYWHDRIKHWAVHNGSYLDIPNVEATWFVDPPYSNAAGKLYQESDIDYADLRNWVLSRKGQVIVCGNTSETWLPFKRLAKSQGTHAGHISNGRSPEGLFYIMGREQNVN